MKTSREYKKFRKRQLCLFKVIENIAKTFKGPTLRANYASLNSLKTWTGPTWRAHRGELHCKLWGSHGWFFFFHPHPPLFFIINITTVILRLIIIPFQLLVYHVWEEPSSEVHRRNLRGNTCGNRNASSTGADGWFSDNLQQRNLEQDTKMLSSEVVGWWYRWWLWRQWWWWYRWWLWWWWWRWC